MPNTSITFALFQPFSNRRGQSMISVLTALPIALITVMLLGQMTQITQRAYFTFRAGSESSKLQNDLRSIIVSTQTCAAHLEPGSTIYNSAAATSTGMDLAFHLDDGVSIIRANSKLDRYDTYVNSLKYEVSAAAGTNFASDPRIPGNMLQYGAIIMNSRSTTDIGKETKDRAIGSMVLSVNPSGVIERCFLLDQALGLCNEAGGSPDPTTGVCRMPGLCPGQVFFGYDSSGNLVCKPLTVAIATACPPDTVLISDGSGGAVCGAPSTTSTGPGGSGPGGSGPGGSGSGSGPYPQQPSEPQYTYTNTQLTTPSSTMPAACKAFLTDPTGVNFSGTTDITITGQTTDQVIPLARNATITGNTANYNVQSAYDVTITGNSGSILTRSWSAEYISGNSGGTKAFVLRYLKDYQGNSGDLCVSAQGIGSLSGGSGEHQVVATSIANITGNSGNMHIYGATVNTASGNSGTICLHNGATIVNYDSSNSGAVSTTCP